MSDKFDHEEKEWIDSLKALIAYSNPDRVKHILDQLNYHAMNENIIPQTSINTPYINTINHQNESQYHGDIYIERKIRSLIRWNALAMVMRANKKSEGIGGHISSFASSATLYDVAFNHYFKGNNHEDGGDLIFFQGHISPGIYARSFLEGRLNESDLDSFRFESHGGLSSYPHPWLMPDYWQFPTVSMGLGPIQAIYQARYMKYLEGRGLVNPTNRKVWAFLGDGECDEPESLGALGLAGREGLDNLIFVVNCNLQRLDGPVRGNGKIVQELEGQFRGAGWNVIKVLWGRSWDSLLSKDTTGLLAKRMNEVVDGELQAYKAKGGAYTREHFFGKYPELLKLVKDLSDEDIMLLNRGGHDPYKINSAYEEAVFNPEGRPTVILAQTVKGYGMGDDAQANNDTHQLKKLQIETLKKFRDRFDIPLTDKDLEEVPYYRPNKDSNEYKYLIDRRERLGGSIPARNKEFQLISGSSLNEINPIETRDREVSTTSILVRLLSSLVKNKEFGKYITPIVPDEARTFGMEGMFRQLGIYAPKGQLYTPEDSDELMYYKESKDGQILEEGITESGAMSSWIAAGTAYSNYKLPMIPFYVFYSMFGFQRVGDLAWAAGDTQAKGFLIGATSGRTTLNGEGLQHQDGHSHIMSGLIPNCVSYDPAFSYELEVIILDGIKKMYAENKNVFYYITTMNEAYKHPEMPKDCKDGIIKGMYLLEGEKNSGSRCVHLLGSGAILNEVIAAHEILKKKYSVPSKIWSVTSFNELYRDAITNERDNLIHNNNQKSYIQECLSNDDFPVVAATDYVREYPSKIARFIDNNFTALGTDGYGRSDSRENLRDFFEVNRHYIVYTAIKMLYDKGQVSKQTYESAREDINIKDASWEK